MKRIVALLLASIPVLLWAQQPLCPPDDPNCPWNEVRDELFQLGPPDCIAFLTYKWRVCNGRLEIALDESGIRIWEGCMGWDRLQWYHYNYSGLLDYITQALLTGLNFSPQIPKSPPPPCEEGDTTTASVYTASCGIWLKCTYHYQGSVTRECERGHNGIDPLWDPANQTITTTKWFSCGQTCCMREYKICWKYDPIYNNYRIVPLRLIRKQKLIECTGQSNFDRPCEDGC